VAQSSEPKPEPEIAGWFGKIPALGDFATRRLPPSFVDAWDAWLSEELVAAQSVLADAWLPSYQQAPTWCFALMAGVIDRSRWYGAWIPSFDRVGRQFPLTIAIGSRSSVVAPQRLWAVFVATGRRALEPSCGADCVDACLRESLEDQATRAQFTEPFERSIESTLALAGEGSSLWWPWFDEDPTGAAASIFDGLPRGEDFLKLLHVR
jgi:type VI secretion system protein ImpM